MVKGGGGHYPVWKPRWTFEVKILVEIRLLDILRFWLNFWILTINVEIWTTSHKSRDHHAVSWIYWTPINCWLWVCEHKIFLWSPCRNTYFIYIIWWRQQIKKNQQTNKKNFMARIVEINAVSVWFFCVSFSEILNSITTTESIFWQFFNLFIIITFFDVTNIKNTKTSFKYYF